MPAGPHLEQTVSLHYPGDSQESQKGRLPKDRAWLFGAQGTNQDLTENHGVMGGSLCEQVVGVLWEAEA